MDFLFLCHYSYGPMAYSYEPFLFPVPLFLWISFSCATIPTDLWLAPMDLLPWPTPMGLFLWTYSYGPIPMMAYSDDGLFL